MNPHDIIYFTMDHPDLTGSNFMEKYIGIERVKPRMWSTLWDFSQSFGIYSLLIDLDYFNLTWSHFHFM